MASTRASVVRHFDHHATPNLLAGLRSMPPRPVLERQMALTSTTMLSSTLKAADHAFPRCGEVDAATTSTTTMTTADDGILQHHTRPLLLATTTTSTHSPYLHTVNLQTPPKIPSIPVRFHRLVILCQRLKSVLRFLALYKFIYVCAYVFMCHLRIGQTRLFI